MPNSRRLVRVSLLILVVLAMSAWWLRAQQAESSTAKARAGDATAIITDDVVTAGETVHVNANVRGDVAAAGAEVTIAGPIEGYVLGAGRNVRIDAPIGNDVWAAGETVEIDSTVGNNAMLAGRIVHLRPGAVIGEDARLAGDQVTVEGRVERDLRIGADVAHIRGPVRGTVRVRAERVRVEPGAVIGGDLIVSSPRPPEVSPGAQVSGQVRYDEAEERWSWMAWPALWLVTFVALLVLGLATTAIAPARARHVAETLRSRLGWSVLAGGLVLVLVPVGIVALAVTLVGIPLAAAMLALYVLFLMLSGVFVSHGVGGWLLERAHRAGASSWTRVTLGSLIVSLAITVPMVGWVIALAVVVAGTGALVLDQRAAAPARIAGVAGIE
jgi:cytoskeletal protein CcmA (bactofilin family)